MTYIDLDEFINSIPENKRIKWEKDTIKHLTKLIPMSKKQQSKYFEINYDWTSLYTEMSMISNNKCWYSEAPGGSCTFEVDHFRPKNKAHDGIKVTLPYGYWWLAYDLKNFRLAGSIVNKSQRDKLSDNEEVKGKGYYFPLYLQDGFLQCSQLNDDLRLEKPLLLDPTNLRDTTYLAFSADGSPIPSPLADAHNTERVILSIKYLHLDATSLMIQRKAIWDQCEIKINEINNELKSPRNRMLLEDILDKGYVTIRNLAKPTQPYSSVVKSCVQHHSSKYHWLTDLLKVI